MWYYNAEIISSPKSMVINELKYDSSVFQDREKLKELGIKPYRIETPDMRYFDMGALSIDNSGDEVVGTYASIGRNPDILRSEMLDKIKDGLSSRLSKIDWYWMKALKTSTDVPSEIQEYSDALYKEYDSKKTEISAITKLSQIIEYRSRPYTLVSKVKHQADIDKGIHKTTYGPETESVTSHVNMCLNWPMSPDSNADPSFVSLTAD
tara:strand:+ start:907 stop:1530 length:624 start_codon:yes stop_codon:yes gene_type:complete